MSYNNDKAVELLNSCYTTGIRNNETWLENDKLDRLTLCAEIGSSTSYNGSPWNYNVHGIVLTDEQRKFIEYVK